jgi:hypothetical protein
MLHGAVVVMGPEHAQIIAGQGWSKRDVQQFLWENFGKTKRELRRFGKVPGELRERPEDAFIHSGLSADSIILVVAGANNAGVSTVCPSITITPPLGSMGRKIGNGTREVVLGR